MWLCIISEYTFSLDFFNFAYLLLMLCIAVFFFIKTKTKKAAVKMKICDFTWLKYKCTERTYF